MSTDILQDTDKMPFGKHKGKALVNVPAKYLLWLFNAGCDHAALKAYIAANLNILNKEANKVKSYR